MTKCVCYEAPSLGIGIPIVDPSDLRGFQLIGEKAIGIAEGRSKVLTCQKCGKKWRAKREKSDAAFVVSWLEVRDN